MTALIITATAAVQNDYAAQRLWLEVLAFVGTVVGGLFAVFKWLQEQRANNIKKQEAETQRLDELRARREADVSAERARLQEQKVVEAQRRSEHAAELVRDFGAAENEVKRLTIAMALTVYPDDAAPILVNAMGYAGDELAQGLEAALLTIGLPSMPRLVMANRLAARMVSSRSGTGTAEQHRDLFNAEALLSHSRRVISVLLMQCPRGHLCELDLEDVDLRGTVFAGLNFRSGNFRKSVLNGADFSHSGLVHVVLRGASIADTKFTACVMDHADLTGAYGAAVFLGVRGKEINMSRASLRGANLRGAVMPGCTLVGTDLGGALMEGFSATRSSLSHRTCLDGVQAQNSHWQRSRWDDVSADHAVLDSAELSQAEISHSFLNRSRAVQVHAGGVSMLGTSLQGADWRGADFRDAKLTDVSMEGTNLAGANFTGATIQGCRFTGATLEGVSFSRCAVSSMVSLGSSRPSPVRVDLRDASFDEGSEQFRRWIAGDSD